jgi:hypothetical protein
MESVQPGVYINQSDCGLGGGVQGVAARYTCRTSAVTADERARQVGDGGRMELG